MPVWYISRSTSAGGISHRREALRTAPYRDLDQLPVPTTASVKAARRFFQPKLWKEDYTQHRLEGQPNTINGSAFSLAECAGAVCYQRDLGCCNGIWLRTSPVIHTEIQVCIHYHQLTVHALILCLLRELYIIITIIFINTDFSPSSRAGTTMNSFSVICWRVSRRPGTITASYLHLMTWIKPKRWNSLKHVVTCLTPLGLLQNHSSQGTIGSPEACWKVFQVLSEQVMGSWGWWEMKEVRTVIAVHPKIHTAIGTRNQTAIGARNHTAIRTRNQTTIHTKNHAAIRTRNQTTIHTKNHAAIRTRNQTTIHTTNHAAIRTRNQTTIHTTNHAASRTRKQTTIHTTNHTASRTRKQTTIHTTNHAASRTRKQTTIHTKNHTAIPLPTVIQKRIVTIHTKWGNTTRSTNTFIST